MELIKRACLLYVIQATTNRVNEFEKRHREKSLLAINPSS